MAQAAKDLDSVWQKVLGELELSISGHSFKTFVAQTTLSSVEEGTAEISAPNPFSIAQMKARFEPQILQALSHHLPSVQQLSYRQSITPVQSSPTQDDELFTPRSSRSQAHSQSSTTNQTNLFAPQQHLVERYNFNHFVVGSSNRLAYSAAKLVTEKPGTDYNPLFLHGPAGVGKTHLMWAVYGEIQRRNPELQLLYITIEEFYKSFVDSVRKSEAFTTKYREVDVLFVDDIQFIKKKETTQEEFFHTFNALHQANKQIIICSDRPPKEISELEERLRSRFEWGMVVDIQPPDLETRVAILQQKAESKQLDFPLEVSEAIAERISSNIRELEGGFNRVVIHCELHHVEPTIEVVEEVLGSAAARASGRRKPSPRAVLTETARYFGLTIDDLVGKRRSRDIVVPRQVAMYILYKDIGLSYPQIGGHLGGRDHTTIMHGCRKLDSLILQQDPIMQDINEISQRVQQESEMVL